MDENLFHMIANLDKEMTVPATGKKTQVIYHDEHLRAVLFGFSPGEGLSEHTAAVPGILYIVRGEAKITLGDKHSDATVGTWVHMQPSLPHSILAVTETVMLLLLLKCGKPAAPLPNSDKSDESDEAAD